MMMPTGTTLVARDPYNVGVGLHGRIRLGDVYVPADPLQQIDYGTAARQASVERQQQDQFNRAADQQDSAQRAYERQQILMLSQNAVDRAAATQTNLLMAGSNQQRRLLTVGGLLAFVSIVVIAASGALTKPGRRSGKRSKRSRGKKRRSKRRVSVRRSASSAPESISGPIAIGSAA